MQVPRIRSKNVAQTLQRRTLHVRTDHCTCARVFLPSAVCTVRRLEDVSHPDQLKSLEPRLAPERIPSLIRAVLQ